MRGTPPSTKLILIRPLGAAARAPKPCDTLRSSHTAAARRDDTAQYAPRPVITAGIVRAMIEMSSQIDQFSM